MKIKHLHLIVFLLLTIAAAPLALAQVTSPANVCFPQRGDTRFSLPAPGLESKLQIRRVPIQRAPVSTPLHGVLNYANYWEDDALTGMYEIPTYGNPKSFSPLLVSSYIRANGGGVWKDGTYYCINWYQVPMVNKIYIYLNTFDTNTWQQLGSEQLFSVTSIATDMTYDFVTGNTYGCFLTEEDSPFFGTMDLATGITTPIRNLTSGWNAIAAAPDGKLYAIDAQGRLLDINKETGMQTVIGSTGLTPYYASSGTIDQRTGRFYYQHIPSSGKSLLYSIDLTDATATLVYQMPNDEGFYGLYVPDPAAVDEAPDEPVNLQASFNKTDLNGKLTFDIPATLFGGAQGQGEVSYRVVANGTTIADGTSTYGATSVEVPVNVTEDGLYKFGVTLSNKAGDGPQASIEAFVGKDAPRRVTQLKLTRSGNQMTLGWWAPRGCVNNGYFESAQLSYTIVRCPDNVTVADNYKGTTFTDTVEEPERQTGYSYVVTAHLWGNDSEPVQSNVLYMGPVGVPYSDDFEENTLDQFTIIDNNNDGRTWERVSFTVYTDETFMRLGGSLTGGTSDDYLVLPPIYLEGGRNYEFSMRARGDYNTNETNPYYEIGEVVLGTAPAAASLTRVIIEPTEFREDYWRVIKKRFNIDETGVYYIAVHGISGAQSLRWQIDDVAVSEGLASLAPDAVSDLEIAPAADKSLSATVTFTAPTKSLLGQELSSISRIDVMRDGTLVKSFASPAKGASLSFTDSEGITNGQHTYSVVAINEHGDGLPATKQAYIGAKRPQTPVTVTVTETSPGMVTVEWDKVTHDIDGDQYPESIVSYAVMYADENGESIILADNLAGNSWSGRVVDASAPQRFVLMGVVAHTEGGPSGVCEARREALGAPAEMPYIETAVGGKWTVPFDVVTPPYTSCGWSAFAIGEDIPNEAGIMADADGTDGFFAFVGYLNYVYSTYRTGKVKVTGEHPVMTFYRWQFPEARNVATFTIIDADTHESKQLYKFTDGTDGEPGWVREVIDLSEWKNRTVSLEIRVDLDNYSITAFDRLAIENLPEADMAALELEMPSVVKAETPVKAVVAVQNLGRADASHYTVDLLRNGQVVASVTADGRVAPNSMAKLTIEDTPDVMQPAELIYMARVSIDNDACSYNNLTPQVAVRMESPNYPVATRLYAEANGNDVLLTWVAPDPDRFVADTAIEDFEDFESYTTDLTPWTNLDEDHQISGGIEGLVLPVELQQLPWFVFDTTDLGSQYPPFSGNKHACSMYPFRQAQSDDWLISPRLYGGAQEISFYARSYQVDFAETFEVLYSTTDTKPESFTLIATQRDISDQWTRYTYNIPDGAMYFAIRCVSNWMYMLWVDYISYKPDPERTELTLTGYDIWRDGCLHQSLGAEATGWTDAGAAKGNHRYHVTAVYDKGRSRPSNEAFVDMDGLDETCACDIRIGVEGRTIVIAGAAGHEVRVADMEGRLLHSGKGDCRIDVLPGVYSVRAGNAISKVAIR